MATPMRQRSIIVRHGGIEKMKEDEEAEDEERETIA